MWLHGGKNGLLDQLKKALTLFPGAGKVAGIPPGPETIAKK